MITQQHRRSVACLRVALGTLVLSVLAATVAHADVTLQQQSSMHVAGMNIDIASVERTSGDKQRSDSTVRCHGLLALFCHNVQSAEIKRLDKRLEWQLQPKKKLCTETAFPTPEQRAQAQQAFDTELAQMKNCPMPQRNMQTAPDTSHCQMSAPKVNVQQTGEHATVIGHDSRRSIVTLSQTCTDEQTGDVCEFDYGFDLWLTTDDLPGLAERRTFQERYAAAQGLDPNNPQLQGMVQQLMAPYAGTLKQLQTKGAELKGYPLRTTFFLDYGGPHCGKMQQQAQQSQQSPKDAGGRRHGLFGRIASNAVSSGLSGLFHHSVHIPSSTVGGAVAANAANQAADAASAQAGNAVANADANNSRASAAPGAPLPPTGAGMVRMVSFTTEITAIDTSSIDPAEFELPSGYKVVTPKPHNSSGPTCPAGGH